MHLVVNGNIVQKKGALSGFKCKAHCFMPKYQYEFVDATDYDENGTELNLSLIHI